MAKSKYVGPPDKLELYEALVARFPDIPRKGAKNPYTSLNGHMFSFLDSDGVMALRFSEADKKALIEQWQTGPSIQYGSVMRGYAIVPDSLLQDTDALAPFFEKSIAYISSLEPKPTKKPKK